jgi:hypothetical protein
VDARELLPLWRHLGLPVLDAVDADDKTGNGFMVVLDASSGGGAGVGFSCTALTAELRAH